MSANKHSVIMDSTDRKQRCYQSFNMAYFLAVTVLLCCLPYGVLSVNEGDAIRLERTGTQISFPVSYSLTAQLNIVNETSTVILDCLVQNRITDSSAPGSGYNFFRCTQLMAKKVSMPIGAETSENLATNKKNDKDTGSTNGNNGKKNTVIYWTDPVVGAITEAEVNASKCRNIIINSIQMEDMQYQIKDREKKLVVLSVEYPDTEEESHVVWTSNTGSAYLLENLFWYRLFSIIPMSISYTRLSMSLSNKSKDGSDSDYHACRDYASMPAHTNSNQLSRMIHRNSPPSLVHDLSHMIRTNQSYHYYGNSYMCAPLADNEEEYENPDDKYGRRFAASPHQDYGCCPVAHSNNPCTEKKAPMPCLMCFYKVILYVLWWLVIFPICLVLPFHSAYERCDYYGTNQKKGEYYKINSTSSMLFTLVCESLITKTVLYIILVLMAFFQIWSEFGRYGEYLAIPIWVYICLILTLVLVPLIKIGWESCSKDIDIELHQPTKYTNKVIHDTFFGVIILPEYCQIHDLLVPVRSSVRLHIIYRMRLLFNDSYWMFCCRDIPLKWTGKKWAGILLAPIMIILGILNTLPLIYLLSNFILLCKNRRVMGYMKRRWLGFIIAVVILSPILIAASYTVLLILFYSTSIVILDIATLPVLVLYLFVLDYIWQNFTRMNMIYTQMIAYLVEEHQKMIKGMHKGYVSSLQQGDVFDSDNKLLHATFKRSGMFNRSYRDYISHLFPYHDKPAKPEKPNINNNARYSTYSDFDSFDSNYNNNARTSFNLPLIDSSSKRSSSQPGALKSGNPFVLHYSCSTLFINAKFHDDLLAAILPPSVCTFKVILNVLLLGIGYIFLDYFFRCYAPVVPCCLFILLFLVLGLARVLMALRQHYNIFNKELQLQVRAHLERHYILSFVDWEDLREIDYSLTTEGSVYEKDLESMGTGDDVPLWPPRSASRERDKKPEYKVTLKKPVPTQPNHHKPPIPRRDKRDESPISYIKPTYEIKPREENTKKPVPIYSNKNGKDPIDRKTPEKKTPTKPKEESPQKTDNKDKKPKHVLPVTYVKLREKPDEPDSAFKPRSTTSLPIMHSRPTGRQVGRRGASPGRGVSPKRNSRPATPRIVEPEDLDSPDGDPSENPIYLIEPSQPPQNITTFYTIHPGLDNRPRTRPTKTMTLDRDPNNRYTVLPALEPNYRPSTRTATLRRHTNDRHSVPEPIEIPLPDSSDTSFTSFQSVEERGNILLGYRPQNRHDNFRQQSKSYETL